MPKMSDTERKKNAMVVSRAEAREEATGKPGDFMSNVGKAALKGQQEEMSETASVETARLARQKKTASKYSGVK